MLKVFHENLDLIALITDFVANFLNHPSIFQFLYEF